MLERLYPTDAGMRVWEFLSVNQLNALIGALDAMTEQDYLKGQWLEHRRLNTGDRARSNANPYVLLYQFESDSKRSGRVVNAASKPCGVGLIMPVLTKGFRG